MFLFILFVMSIHAFTPRFNKIDSRLKPYFDYVSKLSDGNLTGVRSAGFVKDAKKTVLATCYTGLNEVRVSKDKWDKMTERARLIVIAHEIGHCACGSDHIDGRDLGGCAVHFMDSHDSSESCNIYKWKDYVQQMKTLPCGKKG